MLLVLLGAAAFPHEPKLSSPAFAASNAALKAWMLDAAHGPAVRAADCLDLFDSAKSWNDQEGALLGWLAERLRTAPAPTDLVIHYVGHGGFRDATRDYYLAIRATRPENRFYSSLMVDSLWRAVRGGARHLRRFLIIDACFAAAAARALMSPLEEVVKVKVHALQEEDGAGAEAAPDRGTAVLCSSSAEDASSLAGAGGVTQFTEGLLAALAAGSATAGERLTLAELRGLVRKALRARYGPEAVLPEVHAPDQRLGLPQEVPLFPNLARRPAAARVPAAPRGRSLLDLVFHLMPGNPSRAAKDRDNFLILRPQYALSWNAADGRANWVSWHLRESDLGEVRLPEKLDAHSFRADPEAPTVTRFLDELLDATVRGEKPPGSLVHLAPAAPVQASDFGLIGLSRRRLCPLEDRGGSAADKEAVSLMSNVVPTALGFDVSVWNGLEEHCRDLARQGWELFIVAGPGGEFRDNGDSWISGRIARGRIKVPGFLWKVVLALPPAAALTAAPTRGRVYAIRVANGPDPPSAPDWRAAQVTVGSLEDELGYTFFDGLGPAASGLKQRIEGD